jgi:AraC family transcriptional regulator
MQDQNGAHVPADVEQSLNRLRDALPGRPESGVRSYDRAIWSKWLPEARQAVRAGEVASILQLTHADAAGETEIEAPAAPSIALLFWMRGQRVRCKLDGAAHQLRAQPWQFTLVPGGCRSWWVGTGADLGDVFHLHLDASLLDRVADEQQIQQGAAALAPRALLSDPVISQLATWLLRDTADETRPTRLLMDTIGTAVALRLLASDRRATDEPARGLAPWQLKRVQNYLDAHLCEEVSLASLANLLGLSTYYFCRAFKRSTGVPPYRWFTGRRMEHAARLLTETDWPIVQISAEVGYSDASAFASAFRQHQRFGPNEYRRRHRSV